MSGKPQPIQPRFWSKVKKTKTCWIWTAHKNNKGYGMFGLNSTMKTAHRLSFLWARGDIPKGMCVLHKCDTPACINPKHLFLGTKAENNADMIKKGRDRKAVGENVWQSKLKEKEIRQIRILYNTGKYSTRELGKKFGVSHTPIIKIINKKTWKHVN